MIAEEIEQRLSAPVANSDAGCDRCLGSIICLGRLFFSTQQGQESLTHRSGWNLGHPSRSRICSDGAS